MTDWKRPVIADAPEEPSVVFIVNNARAYEDKSPDLAMLLEEVAELAAALSGRHEHDAFTELVQIAGICLNWMGQLREITNAEHRAMTADQKDAALGFITRQDDWNAESWKAASLSPEMNFLMPGLVDKCRDIAAEMERQEQQK